MATIGIVQTVAEYDRENGFRIEHEVPLWKYPVDALKDWGYSLCTPRGLVRTARRRIPILAWLPKYKLKNVVSDLIAGITVGIYNVPQGMAYSVLASLPPVYGLYASFFPPLIYALLGTGFHTSIGVFSITCMMIGHARTALLPDGATSYHEFSNLQPVDIVAALSFATGIIQLAMWLFRLEFLTAYMSDAVVNGFMFGAAVHSARSQIPALLGIKVPRRDSDFFMLIYQIIDICKALSKVNLHVLAISGISILFLVASRIFAAKCWPFKKVPFPSELLLLVGTTFFSHFMHIQKKWNVPTIEDIPTGFPPFKFPKLELIPDLISYAISIAVIAFAITVSMGKMFAKKHGYAIHANQVLLVELLALGSVSLISSLFNVFPTSCSLSRTLVNEASGAKSQVSGVVAAGITLIVILFVGPLLEDLPMCVLSAIVIVALRSLLFKVVEISSLWRVSKIDCVLWVISAAAVLLYDMVEGLIVGVVCAVLSVIARPALHEMGRLPCGDYRVANRFDTAVPPLVPVIRFDAPLIFTNVERFKRAIRHEINTLSRIYVSDNRKLSNESKKIEKSEEIWDVVILDCSTWVYTDSMGIEAVKELILEMLGRNILVLFSEVRSGVIAQYRKSGVFDVASEDQFYPSTSHAHIAAEVVRKNGSKFIEAAGLADKLRRSSLRCNDDEE